MPGPAFKALAKREASEAVGHPLPSALGGSPSKNAGHEAADWLGDVIKGAAHEYLIDGTSNVVQGGGWNADPFSTTAGAIGEGITGLASLGRKRVAAATTRVCSAEAAVAPSAPTPPFPTTSSLAALPPTSPAQRAFPDRLLRNGSAPMRRQGLRTASTQRCRPLWRRVLGPRMPSRPGQPPTRSCAGRKGRRSTAPPPRRPGGTGWRHPIPW